MTQIVACLDQCRPHCYVKHTSKPSDVRMQHIMSNVQLAWTVCVCDLRGS